MRSGLLHTQTADADSGRLHVRLTGSPASRMSAGDYDGDQARNTPASLHRVPRGGLCAWVELDLQQVIPYHGHCSSPASSLSKPLLAIAPWQEVHQRNSCLHLQRSLRCAGWSATADGIRVYDDAIDGKPLLPTTPYIPLTTPGYYGGGKNS